VCFGLIWSGGWCKFEECSKINTTTELHVQSNRIWIVVWSELAEINTRHRVVSGHVVCLIKV
jgi:hypothetical protein